MPLPLESQIEALLFWNAAPMKVKDIAGNLSLKPEDIEAALTSLATALSGRGLSLIRSGEEVTLATHQEMGPAIEKLTKEELMRDLGKAGLETLSIILYQGPVARADIDYIRGVNSQHIVRSLLVRGLVKKVENPKDERKIMYEPTLDLLSYLGVSSVNDLPDRERVMKEIESHKSPAKESAAEANKMSEEKAA